MYYYSLMTMSAFRTTLINRNRDDAMTVSKSSFVVAMTILTVGRISSAPPSKQQLIQLHESTVGAIRSYDLHIDCLTSVFVDLQSVTPDERSKRGEVRAVALRTPRVIRAASRQVFDQGKLRIEPHRIGNVPSNVDVIVSDGSIQRTYHAESQFAGIEQPELQPLPYGQDYRELYRSVLGPGAISLVLRERSNIQISLPADGPMVEVESDPCPKTNAFGNGFGYRVIFDPRVGMLPTSIEMFQVKNGQRIVWHRLTVTEHKRLNDGAVVPIRATTEFFWTQHDEHFGKLQSRQETTVDLSRSRWNEVVDAKEFRIALPAGVRVYDKIRGLTFTTGKADPGENLDDLAKHARRVIHHQAQLAETPASSWYWWTIGGVIGAGLLIGLISIWRRSARVQSP